MNKKILEKYGI